MLDLFRREPLHHYPMDRFSIKSPFLYRAGQTVVHVGGGPTRNHPQEINLNVCPTQNVDVLGNAERLPLGDESVDVVISNAVLEHVRNLEAALGEIQRVLKPGGLVYIEIPFTQPYHTDDLKGVHFEDYRRLTKAGLRDAFGFCTPLDVGVCVGPISAVFQTVFSFLKELSAARRYRALVERAYYFIANLFVWLDAHLSDAAIQRAVVPSGVYFFGRKRDGQSADLERLPAPNTHFPRDVAATIVLEKRTWREITLNVTNVSKTWWLRTSLLPWGAVHVGLQRIAGGELDRDFKRLELPRDIAPGESFEIDFDVQSLADADAVIVDLVVEGVCWFEQRGSRPLKIDLPS